MVEAQKDPMEPPRFKLDGLLFLLFPTTKEQFLNGKLIQSIYRGKLSKCVML